MPWVAGVSAIPVIARSASACTMSTVASSYSPHFHCRCFGCWQWPQRSWPSTSPVVQIWSRAWSEFDTPVLPLFGLNHKEFLLCIVEFLVSVGHLGYQLTAVKLRQTCSARQFRWSCDRLISSLEELSVSVNARQNKIYTVSILNATNSIK